MSSNLFNSSRVPRLTIASLIGLAAQYIVPALIVACSIFAMIFWPSRYANIQRLPLKIQVFQEHNGQPLTFDQAREVIGHSIRRDSYETHRSENPIWLSFAGHAIGGRTSFVDFPSRHLSELTCWSAEGNVLLGTANRVQTAGDILQIKAGFALKLHLPLRPIICRAKAVGPASLAAYQLTAEGLQASAQYAELESGLLEGSITVLAIFIFLVALVNRQLVYVIFSTWLILNLRAAALSAGWDFHWLGHTIPVAYLPRMRAITFSLYALTTLALFLNVFAGNLVRSRLAPYFRVAGWLCIPLITSALVLEYADFLPVMWATTGYGLALMCISLLMHLRTSRSAVWFCAALGAVFVCNFAELFSASFNIRSYLAYINSVTAAVASSLFAALALAEQLRSETSSRIEAQMALQHAYEAMPVGLFTLDQSGRFLSSNPLLAEMLSAGQIVEQESGIRDFFSQDDCARLFLEIASQIAPEMQLKSLNGKKQFLLRATLARGKIEGFLQDITAQVIATEKLDFLANNDSLTRTFNRRGLEKIFDTEVHNVSEQRPLCLAYLDLNRFKLINDLFGHRAGDEVLVEVCDRVKEIIPPGCELGRLGGDEFLVILPNTSFTEASLICRAIVDRIGRNSYRVADSAFSVRCSMGLIEFRSKIQMKDAVSAADRACMDAKRGKTDGLTAYAYDAFEIREHEAQLHLIESFSRSGAPDGLFLQLQPILSLSDPYGSINFRSVLHMRHEDGALLPVAPILAAAESTGRGGMIDRWILSKTLEWMGANFNELSSTQFVCVNLGGGSINDEKIVQEIIRLLLDNEHLTARLCLSISEAVALYDMDNTRRFLSTVHDTGAKVALENFGAGFSAFSYLKELPVEFIDIDSSLIDSLGNTANDSVVTAIVNLAANLGIQTIAGPAADVESIKRMAALGIDYAQGFPAARQFTTDEAFDEQSAGSMVVDSGIAQFLRAQHGLARGG